MRNVRSALLACLTLITSVAAGQDTGAVATLTRELKARTPSDWLVRVRWRDNRLLASITPLPYDTAFQLWYEPEKLHELLVGLCPRPEDRIWTVIESDQDIVLEPTVGGKSGTEAQVACRAATAT